MNERREPEEGRTSRWVVENVIHLLYEVMRGGNPAMLRIDLAGVTVGVVTALKLVVRLETSGTTVLTAVPRGIDAIVELSDELAEEFFDELAGDVYGVGTLQARLGPDRFARTENTLTFRLASPLALNEKKASGLDKAIALSGVADAVVERMMILFNRAMRALDEESILLGKLAFIVGFTAVAKMLMGLWGRGVVASCIETIAESDSDALYRELRSLEPDN